MYIPRSFVVALLSAPFLAYAQSNPNPFNNPSGGYQVTAGKPLTLSWKPTTGGTVSLVLRMGNSGDLSTGTTFASNIPNDGSYTWNVPADTVRGSSYTIEIVSDQDSSETNYTPPFILESTNNAAPTSSGMTMTASTAASTVTPSSTDMSSSMASMTMSSDSASSSMMSMTNTDSTMTTATSSGSSSSETNASTSSNGDLVAGQNTSSSTSTGGVARATAMAGMLGVVALGALAL